ncbi:helix-turn-helix domain-containing protein [Paenibacillus whitsoniae]|uniref:Helix-turn-helix domain-containing protein n=1 Tax=Paenibacillus whitsoniae TaxID=2496558 RepID=A0A3S0AP23_9BACL|nr:helix-turn-helix domain-containing protein [Paenibacillus whitsoniae]RTE08920.1 helix-turn-helix domain-containing protein [Paenibacillus whitsoniae]
MAKHTMDYAINEMRAYGILISGHYKENEHYVVQRPPGIVDWLFMYTISGEGMVITEEDGVVCRQGDVALLLPGLSHHYRTHGSSWEFVWVHFIPDPEWNTWMRFPERCNRFVHISIADMPYRFVIEEAMKRMHLHSLQGANSLHIRLSMIALEEALLHVRLASMTGSVAAIDPRIADILHFLQHSFRNKVSLPELAKRSCLSTSRLSHLFKEQVGDTIVNTLHKFRLEKAAQLLVYTTRQVSEIAEDVGFDSIDHFSRLFKAYFSVTPSTYRKDKAGG